MPQSTKSGGRSTSGSTGINAGSSRAALQPADQSGKPRPGRQIRAGPPPESKFPFEQGLPAQGVLRSTVDVQLNDLGTQVLRRMEEEPALAETGPLEKFAEMVERHWTALSLGGRKDEIPMGFVEGMNNKIRRSRDEPTESGTRNTSDSRSSPPHCRHGDDSLCQYLPTKT